MKIVEGDLVKLALDGEFELIVHGCNCFCTMGAGIAKTIKEKFPEVYEIDLQTEKGSKEKLGKISYISLIRKSQNIIIVNGYTQFMPSGNGVLVDYNAVRNVMKDIKNKFSGKKIGYPMIGAGLAKGDWSIISSIIDEELNGEDHTLVVYKP